MCSYLLAGAQHIEDFAEPGFPRFCVALPSKNVFEEGKDISHLCVRW